jgi:hypothetical protein
MYLQQTVPPPARVDVTVTVPASYPDLLPMFKLKLVKVGSSLLVRRQTHSAHPTHFLTLVGPFLSPFSTSQGPMLGAINNMSAIESEIGEHADELLAIVKAPREILALQLRRLQVCCFLSCTASTRHLFLSYQRGAGSPYNISLARCVSTFSLKHRSAAVALVLSRASCLPLKQCKPRSFKKMGLQNFRAPLFSIPHPILQ